MTKVLRGRMEAENELLFVQNPVEASSDIEGSRSNSEWACSCRGGRVGNIGLEQDT